MNSGERLAAELQADFLAKSDEARARHLVGTMGLSDEEARICIEAVKREWELQMGAASSHDSPPPDTVNQSAGE